MFSYLNAAYRGAKKNLRSGESGILRGYGLVWIKPPRKLVSKEAEDRQQVNIFGLDGPKPSRPKPTGRRKEAV